MTAVAEIILAPVELTARQASLFLCPACLMDMCDTCLGGACICACIDSFPSAGRAVTELPRCRRCGYAKTAPGHRIACEPAEVKRARLEEAAAEYYRASR